MKKFILLLLIFLNIKIAYAQILNTFKDLRDGSIYKIVLIGKQVWMAENLRYLPSVRPSSQESLYYVYDYQGTDVDEAKATVNFQTYGVLYNWTGANSGCPTGWHLPSDEDWKELEIFLGMNQEVVETTGYRGTDEGNKLKEEGTLHWNNPNSEANNSTHFTALPGGYRFYGGEFTYLGITAYFWTSTEFGGDKARYRELNYNSSQICRSEGFKSEGFSVRCVKEYTGLEVTDSAKGPLFKINICGNEVSEVIISNFSNDLINITSIYNNKPLFSTNYSSATLSSGDTIHLKVNFNPTEAGVFLDTVFIESDEEMNPLIIIPINAIYPSYIPEISVLDSTNISCGELSNGTARVQALLGNPPYQYQWDDPLNTTDSVVRNLSADKYYHVTAIDRYGCLARDSIMLSESETLVIDPDYSHTICLNNKDGYINLNTSGGKPPYSFAWSNGQTTENLNSLDSGNYSVNISDEDNCLVTGSFKISVIKPYENEEICMVTVDPASGRNMILWERTPYQNIFSYNIYRETSVKDIYELIGNSLFTGPGSFLDDKSNPAKQSYKYKITAIDNCANESGLSSYHSTMHLTLGIGLNNATNLIWSKYEGFDVQTYNIWRGATTEEMNLIGAVSGSNFTFTDLFPLEGINIYQVEVVSPYTCNTENLKAIYGSSVSNFAHRYPEGIFDPDLSNIINIYPNPVTNSAIISFNNQEGNSYNLYITDLAGKLCRQVKNITDSEYNLEKGNLEQGIYLLELRGQKTLRGKLIIE